MSARLLIASRTATTTAWCFDTLIPSGISALSISASCSICWWVSGAQNRLIHVAFGFAFLLARFATFSPFDWLGHTVGSCVHSLPAVVGTGTAATRIAWYIARVAPLLSRAR